MRIVSWNMNSLRGHKDVFLKGVEELNADVLCIQKLQAKPEQIDFCPKRYDMVLNSAKHWWNYGTAIFYRQQPLNIGLDSEILAEEFGGRIITSEYQNFYIVCIYVPYSNKDALDQRRHWDAEFEKLVHQLQLHKPVIICGDMNIVREPVDAFDLKAVKKMACYMPEEHEDFERLLANEHLVDAYRISNPATCETFDIKERGIFTTFPNGGNWYECNKGYRLDYFLISELLVPRLEQCSIRDDLKSMMSCPVVLDIRA